MKNILISSFFFFLASFASAQSNFKEGYIITNENDTINGFVDFRTSGINARSCKFKEQELGEVKTYYPGDISGYRFVNEGKFYVSRNIEIEGQKQEVFLEYLLRGIVNLYYYIGNREYYFVENEQGEIFVIDKKDDEYVYNETLRSNVVKKDNKYIGMLKSIFKESQPTLSKIDKIKYNQDDIIKVTKDYHDNVCISGDKCIIFETKKDKQSTTKRITLYTGLQFYTLNLNYLNYGDDIVSLDLPALKSTFPVIGIQINLSVPRWTKSISFQLDAALSGIKGSTIHDYQLYDRKVLHEEYDYKTLLFSSKLGSKYTYMTNRFCPTIELGISTIFLFAQSSDYIISTTYDPSSSDVPDISKKDLFFPGSSYLGYYGAIGVDYILNSSSALTVRLGYESHAAFFGGGPDYKLGSRIKSLSLKLGYTF